MLLTKLRIIINGKPSREINFHDGLNLITNKKNVGRSGNSVGKSTLSRVVDYLFMASIDPIYIDPEFKKANEKIESLFNNSKVEAYLQFIDLNNNIHEIGRNLSIKEKDRTFFIDGKLTEKTIYEETIQKWCFRVLTKRPSLRIIAPKFIRNDSHRMLNTTKFLDTRVGTKDYSELYLYLFGFENTELLTAKREAGNLVTRRKRNNTVLNALIKEQKPSTEIKKYQAQVKELELDFLKFEYSPKYPNPIQQLSEFQNEENNLVEQLLGIDRRIANINRTIELLSMQGGNYLVAEVTAIYKFAQVSVESAIKKYEEVLSFHDTLVAKKREFLSSDLPQLQTSYATVQFQLENVRQSKIAVFADLKSEDSISRITENLKRLGDLKVSLGKFEGLLEQQTQSSKELATAQDSLKVILEIISAELDTVRKFDFVFNTHLKNITQKTHGEPYSLAFNFDEESGICDIDIVSSVSNSEGGKKKAEVIAFDFAYIQAVAELKLLRPRFVFHDSIEDIDQKQIEIIFTIANTLSGQQIISMLSDKFSDDMYERYLSDTVLLLSETDMFFGV